MPRINRRLSTALMLTCGLALLGDLAMSSPAGAATIRACVKKTSGVTRIVHGKAKCKHGEQSLSWGTAGPKGATGPAGPAGSTGAGGANGTSAGFFASTSSAVTVKELVGTVLVSKVLPPGSFIVSTKTVLDAESKVSTDVPVVECGMFDQPGTTPPGFGPGLVDAGAFVSPLAKVSVSTFQAFGTLAFLGSVNSTVATTLDLVCVKGENTKVEATNSQLAAIQVSQIG